MQPVVKVLVLTGKSYGIRSYAISFFDGLSSLHCTPENVAH